MATNIHLTQELESFARSCVDSGRYDNVSDVVRSALRLLQEKEEHRSRFNAQLDAIREETKRDGGQALDDVMAEADRIIEAATSFR
ncbi:MAG: type II toxin-antitoxin system ParD family antitoxin [Magnetococcales bacterium]|nr:type II toxin-antitoxin system ParD family antitoxin [Magnetococcales bacterium]MBF0421060.1 type II toxin-antitoxin system ParD family antitoxin [Magnetococcales bacterium]